MRAFLPRTTNFIGLDASNNCNNSRMPGYDPISLMPDKQCIVVDIGFRYTKFGFGGETSPRCIVPTEAVSADTGNAVRVFHYKNESELRINLVDFIHMLFFKYALIHPKDKRVVIVESLLCPTVIRNALATVLFDHFEVASVLFLPSHVASLYTLNVNTGLVLDVGYQEAVLIPVYEGIPILKAWQALPLGAKSVELALQDGLTNKVKLITAEGEDSMKTFTLNDSVIEDIKGTRPMEEKRIREEPLGKCGQNYAIGYMKGCFVTTLERAQQFDEGNAPTIQPPGFRYRIDGSKVIDVDSIDRELPFETLFKQDNDQMSISTMILDSILKCTLDMRKPLAENIVLIGGTCMTKGFKSRLKEELHYLMKQPKYEEKLFINTFKFHNPPAKENYVAWLGGSICGATDMISMKSLTRDAYCDMNKLLPDWCSLINRSDFKTRKALEL